MKEQRLHGSENSQPLQIWLLSKDQILGSARKIRPKGREELDFKIFLLRLLTQKDGALITSHTKGSLKNFKGMTQTTASKQLRSNCPLRKPLSRQRYLCM